MIGKRRFRGLWLRRAKQGRGGNGRQILLSLLLGLIMAFSLIRWFDIALRPQLVALAEAQVKNHLTRIAAHSVTRTLAAQELSYSDMVTLQSAGSLSALVTDTAALNRLREAVLEDVILQTGSIDSNSLGIPLGALTGIDLLSALGPRLPIRMVSVASADGQYRNDFTGAGINQTLHRIVLDVILTAKLLLPGGPVELVVSTPVCVSETVIVGQVPQAYLSRTP